MISVSQIQLLLLFLLHIVNESISYSIQTTRLSFGLPLRMAKVPDPASMESSDKKRITTDNKDLISNLFARFLPTPEDVGLTR